MDRLVQEAELHQEEDKQRQLLVDTRNEADGMIYQIEKSMPTWARRSPAYPSELEGLMNDLRNEGYQRGRRGDPPQDGSVARCGDEDGRAGL